MRRMARAAQPDGVQPPPQPAVDATRSGRRRRLLPPTPSETPKRGRTPSSGKKRKTPSRIPVPFTPEELMMMMMINFIYSR